MKWLWTQTRRFLIGVPVLLLAIGTISGLFTGLGWSVLHAPWAFDGVALLALAYAIGWLLTTK